MSAAKSRRIPSLDGVRAVAIALVIVGHWSESHLTAGAAMSSTVSAQCIAGAFAQLGVRVFFVLSGYLITRLLLDERARTSSISLTNFYKRRARRILPAALCFTLATFGIFHRQLTLEHALAAVFFLANWDPTHPWFLGHLWSLSVEEQFYLLWPATLKKWGAHSKAVLCGVILCAPLSRVVCHLAHQHGRWDETLFLQADILAVGCMLAVLESEGKLPRVSRWAAGVMGLVVVSATAYTGFLRFHLTPALLLVAWPGLYVSIAGLLLRVMQAPPRWLNTRPVIWLGSISYSLYLWQQLFAFGKHSAFAPLGAVVLACASYYGVERPFMRNRAVRLTAAVEKPDGRRATISNRASA